MRGTREKMSGGVGFPSVWCSLPYCCHVGAREVSLFRVPLPLFAEEKSEERDLVLKRKWIRTPFHMKGVDGGFITGCGENIVREIRG